MDNLSNDMIQCKKDGFGCHYGAWKATQEVKPIEPKGIPEGFCVCVHCGMVFKPKKKRNQLYCGAYCSKEQSDEWRYQREKEERRAINGKAKSDACKD